MAQSISSINIHRPDQPKVEYLYDIGDRSNPGSFDCVTLKLGAVTLFFHDADAARAWLDDASIQLTTALFKRASA